MLDNIVFSSSKVWFFTTRLRDSLSVPNIVSVKLNNIGILNSLITQHLGCTDFVTDQEYYLRHDSSIPFIVVPLTTGLVQRVIGSQTMLSFEMHSGNEFGKVIIPSRVPTLVDRFSQLRESDGKPRVTRAGSRDLSKPLAHVICMSCI